MEIREKRKICINFWNRLKQRIKTPFYLFSILLGLVTGIVGHFFWRSQEIQAKQDIKDQLITIAELKAQQIKDWLNERLADARVLVESPFFSRELCLYFQHPDENRRQLLIKRLSLMAEAYNYRDIIIFDAEKKTQLRLQAWPQQLSPECFALLEKSAQKLKPVFSDLHKDPYSQVIYFDVAAPFFSPETQKNGILGFGLFKIDAQSFLFPLIQSWPFPSKTAETLLVRQEGEEVLFLNELRHRSQTALSFRLPLSERQILAVKAILGESGFVEGLDYRGEKVLGYIAPIPSTPWFMVAQIKSSEALQPWRTRSLLIILVVFSLLMAQFGLAEYFWQRKEKVYYQKLYQAEARARESEDLFRILNESSLAGVYLIQDGVLRYVNQAAAKLFGYTPEELIDKENPLVVVHPKDKALVQENIRRRLSGEIKSLRYEFLGVRKDGSTLHVEVHGSFINYRGKPAIIGNLIDITERKTLYEEVKKTESELRATLYSIGDGVIVTDLEGKIRMMNPVAEKLTGWKEIEAKGKVIDEVFHLVNEFTRQPVSNPVARVLREGIVVGLANHSILVSRDGQEYPVADSGAPILGPDGKLIGVVLVFRDQTEERQARKALERSEREKAAILDGMKELVLYQAPDHTIIWANRAAAASLGLKPEDLVGQRCYELWHRRQQPCENCPVARARDTGCHQEDEVKTPDGRYWHISGSPVFNEKGQVIGMIEVTLEITEKVKAEQNLKASEERYRRLAENAQDIIYRYTFYPQRGFEYVNPAVTKITGYTPEEHYADPDLGFKIVLEEDRPLLEAMTASEIRSPVVIRWRRKDGEIIWTEQRNVPIYDDQGRLVALEGIARDVTERIKAEAALQRSLREKEILLREIHHRVKNNMQVISSMINLQAHLIENEKVKEIFKQCQKRIRSMALVHEKLYSSPDLTSIDFGNYLESIAQIIFHEYQWQLGQIEMEKRIEPLRLNINLAIPLGLIVNELLTNCFKHAFPQGRSGKIWITLEKVTEKRAKLEIKDNGVGIPEDIEWKKPKTMGLTIIDALVDQIDGEMEIDRVAGTAIRIFFPLP